MAFASRWIRDPQDIYDTEIPARLESVPIEWAENWKTVPLLRRSVRDSTRKVFTSPTQPSSVIGGGNIALVRQSWRQHCSSASRHLPSHANLLKCLGA